MLERKHKELRETFSLTLMKLGIILILCIMGFSISAQTVRTFTGTTWAQLGTFISGTGVTAGDIVELTAVPTGINSTLAINKSITLRSSSGNNFVLTKTNTGRHITLGSNTHLILENITLDGDSIGGGIDTYIYYDSFLARWVAATNITLTLNSGAVIQRCLYSGNSANTSGGGGIRFITTSGAININDGAIIQNNRAVLGAINGGGGGIHCASGAAVNINGGIIRGNIVSGSDGLVAGGGILVGGGSVLTMIGGTISNNISSIDGGGIAAARAVVGVNSQTSNLPGTVRISGGQITNNLTGRGGGIALVSSILELSGNVLISENEAISGGGIHANINYNNNPSTITMSGGTITENKAVGNLTGDNGGGGIFVSITCTLTMTGGTISNNTALIASGGGICLNTNPTSAANPARATISGGVISGNTATRGGGIFVRDNNTALTITGGTISNNTAVATAETETAVGAGCGGGIYMMDRSKLKSSTAVYSNNKAAFYVTDISTSDQATHTLNITKAPGSFTINPSTGEQFIWLFNNYDVNYDAPLRVTFYPNNGKAPITIGIPSGDTVAPPIVTYAQHVFEGWYTNSDLTGTAFDFSTPITDNMEFWAKWNNLAIYLNLKLFLQGVTQPGPVMTNNIQVPTMPGIMPNLKLPVINPYGLPDSCSKINNVSAIGEIVDWILVEIWGDLTVNGMFTDYTLLAQRALLLKPDGSVVDTTGQKPQFIPFEGDVRIMVKHRSHLSVISSELLTFSGKDTVIWDFSTGIDKALKPFLATYDPMILQYGVASLWAGDLNMNDIIDHVDMSIFNMAWKSNTLGQYMAADINMDGAVNSIDLSFVTQNTKLGLYSPMYFFRKR